MYYTHICQNFLFATQFLSAFNVIVSLTNK